MGQNGYHRACMHGFEAEEYVTKTAKTLQEALDLANAGFQLWDEFEGTKIYRKRK